MRTEAVSAACSERLMVSAPAFLAGRQSASATTRSSELLEILRLLHSAGGAEQYEGDDLQLDMMDVAAALADLEAEIEVIIARGRCEAERLHQQALDEVRRIDEVDVRVPWRSREQPEGEQRTIMQRAAADTERVRRGADAEISEIVAAATALVWEATTTLRAA